LRAPAHAQRTLQHFSPRAVAHRQAAEDNRMCELMALSFAQPASADFSVRAFAARAEENADGWGLGWYPDRSLAVVKEPIKWGASAYPGFLETYPNLLAPIYVAHVREGSTGGAPTHADTHPFARELGGREYCFAHNGTLAGYEQLPLGRFHPIGRTDSEQMFCHLLEDMAQQPEPLLTETGWRWLHDKLLTLNRMGKLNCLLTDGQRLFAYHDAAGYKGLHRRQVHFRDGATRRFEDPALQIDLAGSAVNHGFVIATCPLSATGWQSFQPGELNVLEYGMLRFSSHAR
jgi:predicted glutamine amidotransferase